MSTVSYGMICAGRASTVFNFCDSTATTFTACGEPDAACCTGAPACDDDGAAQPTNTKVDTSTTHERNFIARPPANQRNQSLQNQDHQDRALPRLAGRAAARSRRPWAIPAAWLRWQTAVPPSPRGPMAQSPRYHAQ